MKNFGFLWVFFFLVGWFVFYTCERLKLVTFAKLDFDVFVVAIVISIYGGTNVELHCTNCDSGEKEMCIFVGKVEEKKIVVYFYAC